MNEFEWLQQMRRLHDPVAPRRDLWRDIDARLADRDAPLAAASRVPHRTMRPWLLAAAVAGAFALAGSIGLHLHHAVPTTTDGVRMAAADWRPADPRLTGAAIQLDAARQELQQALEQSPDSPMLQRLLARTQQQQTQLRTLAGQAG